MALKLKEIQSMEDTLLFEYLQGKDFKLNFQTKYGFIRSLCQRDIPDDINNFVKQSRYKNFIQIGIGGSALGATASIEFLSGTYYNYEKDKQFFALDNIDPERMRFILTLDPNDTLFHVVSKSGATIETISQFLILYKKINERLGDNAKDHFVFTTDRDAGFLRKFSKTEQIKTFDLAKEAGGRYSVFTPVGLLPIAFFGYNINKFLDGGKDAVRAYRNGWSLPNDFVNFAVGEYESAKNILVVFAYKDRLYSIADWFRQLWAESLGKDLKGQTPVKALGVTDQHSQLQLYQDGPKDKAVVFLDCANSYDIETIGLDEFDFLNNKKLGEIMKIEKQSTRKALEENGVPTAELFLNEVNEYTLGALFASLMIATAKAGDVLGVNAFDQPGVELGKKYTKEELTGGV